MWREEFDVQKAIENVPAVDGYSSTALFIDYIADYLIPHPEILHRAEREYRKKWYSQKKKEILLWYRFKNGYNEQLEKLKKKIARLQERIKEEEKYLLEYKLTVNREMVKQRLKKMWKDLEKWERKTQRIWEKKFLKFEEWVPGEEKEYRETVWWKFGFAWDPPSMERLIQDSIEDYWKRR